MRWVRRAQTTIATWEGRKPISTAFDGTPQGRSQPPARNDPHPNCLLVQPALELKRELEKAEPGPTNF